MSDGLNEDFEVYMDRLVAALGHADREEPFRDYTTGLLLPLERKSVEPIAARMDPTRAGAKHQSLHHFVAKAEWSDRALLEAVREAVVPSLDSHGPIEAWIVDDTGFPKKGRHSVGVARQYCGQLGKQDNCQVAVSLSVAHEAASLPIDYRLYLPKEWAEDGERRQKGDVPEEVTFQTKPAIALDQIEAALAAGVSKGVVLADAGYGADMKFQERLIELDVEYVVGVQPRAKIWTDGHKPLAPKGWSGRGRPPTNLRRDGDHQPREAKTWAMQLPENAWQTVTWRQGVKDELSSRFAHARVRPAHRDYWRNEPWPELTVLAEWPEDEPEPIKIWLANLPADTPLSRLVHLAKLRWRIERDYLELKQELGLGHYEGRGWRGFHHHASLCIAAYGFLVQQRLATFPSGENPGPKSGLDLPPLPENFVPRGSPRKARTTQSTLHRHHARPYRHPPRPKIAPMSMLHAMAVDRNYPSPFMTQ
jgi:SRSO17 transposase